MDNSLVSLISGLVGALIGASASIITVLVQTRLQDRRERLRLVSNLALEDYKLRLQHKSPGAQIVPVSLFLDFHMRLAKALGKASLTPELYEAICKENDLMLEKMKQMAASASGSDG